MDNTKQDTMSVECPYCNERFVVVREQKASEQTHTQQQSSDERDGQMDAELLNYEIIDGGQPYSGRDEPMPVKQCVRANIEIDGERYTFTFWYTPEDEHVGYVVRVNLSSGPKTKSAYRWEETPYVEELSYTDRGIPKDSDKKWTYLSLEECRRRAKIAGLPEPESCGDLQESSLDPHRNTVWIGEKQRPPIEDDEVAEELLLKLAKGLLVFQTDKY